MRIEELTYKPLRQLEEEYERLKRAEFIAGMLGEPNYCLVNDKLILKAEELFERYKKEGIV